MTTGALKTKYVKQIEVIENKNGSKSYRLSLVLNSRLLFKLLVNFGYSVISQNFCLGHMLKFVIIYRYQISLEVCLYEYFKSYNTSLTKPNYQREFYIDKYSSLIIKGKSLVQSNKN